MKKGKDYLILAGALLLVGAGIGLQHQHAEINELRAKLSGFSHGQSVRADEKAGLERRLRAAEAQVQALQAELDRARATVSVKLPNGAKPE